jgi:hypothetical protein
MMSPVNYTLFSSHENEISLALELNEEYSLQAFHFNSFSRFGPKIDMEFKTETPPLYTVTAKIYGDVPIYKHTDIASALAIGLGTSDDFLVLRERV